MNKGADLSVDGVYQHILRLQGFSHGFPDALQSGEPFLYIVQMLVLLPFGNLPILHSSTHRHVTAQQTCELTHTTFCKCEVVQGARLAGQCPALPS